MGEASEVRPRRSLLASLGTVVRAPRFPEPIPAELYRLTGVVRVGVIVAVIALTGPIGFVAPQAGFDPDAYWVIWTVNSSLLLGSLALGLAMWRGAHPPERLARLNLAAAMLEMSSLLVFIYGSGSVNSSQTVYAVILLLMHRSVFDYRTGRAVFLVLLVGLWAIVLLEVAGVLPPQPLAGGAVDRQYENAALELSAMSVVSTGIAIAWMTANWMVARFRQKELAMSELRRALAQRDDGELGRHTGKLLGGTYQVGGLIGAGGIGEVYRATHARTSREVALKILREQYLEEPRMLERFRREATILGKLGSPYILEVIDVDQQDGLPFIAVELLRGRTLQERIDAQGALDPRVVCRVVAQVAAGLDLAHEAGVVHRDLKPENVFVVDGADGPVAKILDFGIAKIRDAGATMTNEGSILGTPAFMAPEQASGRTKDVDTPTDVYALGALAYACLAGRPPFEGGSLPTILFRVISTEATPLDAVDPRIPSEAAAAVARALSKKPADRWPSAKDFAFALADGFGAPRPSLAPPRAPARAAPRVDEDAATVDAASVDAEVPDAEVPDAEVPDADVADAPTIDASA